MCNHIFLILARNTIAMKKIQKGTASMIRKRIQERESLKGQKIILEQQQTEVYMQCLRTNDVM